MVVRELGIKHREVVTAFVCIVILVLNVRHNHLISDSATGGCKEATTPEVLAPEALLEFRELLEYLSGRLAFEILCHFGDRDLWRHRNEEVDVIFRYVATDDLYVVNLTDLSDEIAHPGTQSSRKDWLVVLGGPD